MSEIFGKVKSILGDPYYESNDILLYNIDSVQALPLLPPDCVDLIVTSPPYNIGKEYESLQPVDSYIHWCTTWLQHLPRIMKPYGSFWLNVGYLRHERGLCMPISYLLWDKIPFYLLQEIVWHYGAGVGCKNYFSPRNEKILWYVKDKDNYTFNLDEIRDKNVKYPNQKKNGKLRCNPQGKNPSDVWEIPKVTSGRACKERTEHPAQYPSALVERIIKASTNPGHIVLDPFLGSGTTAAVALEHGRKVIGFEIREDYCKIAKERLSKQ